MTKKYFFFKNSWILLFLFLFSGIVNAQCTITGVVNASDYKCSGSTPSSLLNGCTIINIGDGTTPTVFKMNTNVDLSCLGAIQLIVNNNSNIDFTAQNYDLILAAGSSITFIGTGTLVPSTGSDCSNSDRIKIGDVIVSSCLGSGAPLSFPELVNQGGYSPITVSATPSSICNSESSVLKASASPSSGATYKWYDAQSGGALLQSSTSDTYNAVGINTTKFFYVEASYSSYTTVRKAVTVTVSPTTVAGTVSANQSICTGSSPADITLTGSTGTIQWQSSSDNSNFSNISGATSSILTSAQMGTLTVIRYYRAVVTSGNCTSANSNIITVTGNAVPAITTQPTAPTVTCSGTGTQTMSVVATGAGLTYSWQLGGVAVTNGAVITGQGTATLTLTNPTAVNAGIYTVVVSGTCTPAVTSTAAIVTVNSAPVITTQPSTPLTPTAICSGSGTQSMTVAAIGTGLSYDWKLGGVSVINGGVINGQGTATLTLTSPTSVNAGSYTVVVSGTCTPAVTSDAAIVTINPAPSTPTAGVVTQPTCAVLTGSFTITNYDSSYIYSLTPSVGVVISGNTVTAPAGTYTIIATSGSCSASSAPVVITSAVITTTIYNGTTWSNGTGLDKVGTITAPTTTPITISAYTELCSCMVNASTNVVVNSDVTLKLQDKLVVNGSLTLENNASLVQINEDPNINSGNITYKRHTVAVRRYDFTYWSSPVTPQTLHDLSPNTLFDKYYIYNPNSGWVISYSGTAPMVAGNGYLIRAPQYFDINTPAIDVNPMFEGVPNNGLITLPSLAGNKAHLLGNPYPSGIDADKFLDANLDIYSDSVLIKPAVLEGTLYFWTHNSPPSSAVGTYPGNDPAKYNYTTNDYATYNRTGGVATAAKVDLDKNDPNDNNNLSVPTGEIAAGQGFFAPASATGGTLVFNNSMRVVGGVSGTNNSQFFKLSTSSKTTTAVATRQKNRIWLNLTNKEGAFKQTLVGYITGATNDYDNGFDGESFDGNQFIDFYSINNKRNLTIQGRALPFVETDVVPLGYRSTIAGSFSISIDQVDGSLVNQAVYLEDKLTNTTQSLKAGAYTFTTEKGTFNDRFVLSYANKTLATEDFEAVENRVMITNKNKEVKISTPENEIEAVFIYDILGKQIYTKTNVDKNELVVTTLIARDQVLIVKVVMKDKSIITKKTIY